MLISLIAAAMLATAPANCTMDVGKNVVPCEVIVRYEDNLGAFAFNMHGNVLVFGGPKAQYDSGPGITVQRLIMNGVIYDVPGVCMTDGKMIGCYVVVNGQEYSVIAERE